MGAPEGLSVQGWWVVSIMVLMLVWRVTETAPVAATALIPLIALPLTGATNAAEAAKSYADPVRYLFTGGFMLAAAIERWGLHARIALRVAGAAGTRPAASARAAVAGGYRPSRGQCRLRRQPGRRTSTMGRVSPSARHPEAGLRLGDR